MKKIGLLSILAIGLIGCFEPDNPLLAASDGQFALTVQPHNSFAMPCAMIIWVPEKYIEQHNAMINQKFSIYSKRPKISAVPEKEKNECILELQKQAVIAGIKGNITKEHIFDEKVKQRYLALNKG